MEQTKSSTFIIQLYSIVILLKTFNIKVLRFVNIEFLCSGSCVVCVLTQWRGIWTLMSSTSVLFRCYHLRPIWALWAALRLFPMETLRCPPSLIVCLIMPALHCVRQLLHHSWVTVDFCPLSCTLGSCINSSQWRTLLTNSWPWAAFSPTSTPQELTSSSLITLQFHVPARALASMLSWASTAQGLKSPLTFTRRSGMNSSEPVCPRPCLPVWRSTAPR